MNGSAVALLVVIAAVVGTIAYFSWKQDQKRKQALLLWATNNGYTFVGADSSWCSRWQGSPFGEGDHQRAVDVVTGTSGKYAFTVFDYSYQTHSSDGRGGRTTTTHNYAVCALALPTYLPRLQLSPETLLSRVGNTLGLDDIELESEDFNRKFRVQCRDPKFASDVLTPRTMQALLSTPTSTSWRFEGTDIVGWSVGKLTPGGATAMMATLALVVDGIPSFVWTDHGVTVTPPTQGGTA